MSSSFGRPQPRRVNAQFDPGQPNRLPGMDRQVISRTPDGRFTDFGSAEVAGANAERSYKEAAAFIKQAGDTFASVYKPWLQNEIDKELGQVAGTPEMFESYRQGDEEARAWISRFRPQTQYYVNQQVAAAGAEQYGQRLTALAALNPVRTQTGSSPEDLAAARAKDKSIALEESGLRNVAPEFLRQVAPSLQAIDAKVDAQTSTQRDLDAKAVQDSGIRAGLGTMFYTGAQADYLQSQRPVSPENLAADNAAYRASKTQSWQQELSRLEESRTSVESATLLWQSANETSTAAFGSGDAIDIDAGLSILDQTWQLANDNNVKTANGQVLGQVVITQDGKTFRQVVAERRKQLQPLADQAEAKALLGRIAPDAEQMLRNGSSPSTVMQYLLSNVRDENGNPDIQRIQEAWSTLSPLVQASRAPTNAQTLLERDFQVRLRRAGNSNAEVQGILNEASTAGLTPEQQLRLAGLAGQGSTETQRLSAAENETVEARKSQVQTLVQDGKGSFTAERAEIDLLSRTQQIQERKVEEFVKSTNGTPPSDDEYIKMYRQSADEAYKALSTEVKGSAAANPQTPEEKLRSELNTISENIETFSSQGTATKIREIFSPEFREIAKKAGVKDDYRSLQKYLLDSLAKIKDADGKPAFPNSPQMWFQMRQRAEKAGQDAPASKPTPTATPKAEEQSFIDLLTPETAGGENKQASAKPLQFIGQALAAIVGGRPAQAGTLEGKPGFETPDAVSQLASVVSGRQDVSLRTPSLPQTPPDTPAEVVPAQISTDTHPYFLAIGIAEGTRTPDGGYTRDYYGHPDPANGARNVGTVSSQQYGSPDVADRVWAGRLSALATRMTPVLYQLGVKPGTVAFNRLMFNRLDLEVQSPAAAADLFRNLDGDYSIEGIAKARADSFINPATGQLEAGGFGNSYNRLFTDQRSRAGAFDYKRRF